MMWHKQIAVGILITMGSGLVLAGVGMYNEVKQTVAKTSDLEAEVKANAEKIDEIHWFLIRRNHVKIPKGK